MSLAPGARLGSYEIVALIGAGGMGEVYRARDGKLTRDVALKILPPLFAHDPERLARFSREANLLATLNHPNIAAIYGFESSDHSPALVLEMVEGPTLADRIERGPIPLDDALAHRPADCRCARSRARTGHRPPRPQAGEHQGSRRRDRQGARLRAGEGDGRRQLVGCRRLCRRRSRVLPRPRWARSWARPPT